MSTTPSDPAQLKDRDSFTYSEALAAGLTPDQLYGLRQRGEIETVSRGLYRWADADLVDLDLLEISKRVPDATLCLGTALAHHGLIDLIPPATDIAIPRGRHRPALRAPAAIHTFDVETFEIGREPLGELDLHIYSAERSLVDVIRLRHIEGSDVAWEALRRWLRKKGSSPAQLLNLASHFHGAEPPLRRALEVVL